jgi:pimeloyl-ACP methyl ester carboxylesterase
MRAFPPPGQIVDVEGGPLHLNCTGQGQPTVVLEAGASQPSIAWSTVQIAVADFTRVCSYDRAGIGWSADADGDTDPEGVARRLRAALTAADVSPPFVMVGQSIGGPLAMIFGDLYPGDVAGYVFVDSADPDRYDMAPVHPPAALQSKAQALAGAVSSVLAEIGFTRWQMRNARQPAHWPDDVFAVAVAFTPQSTPAGRREQAAAPAIVERAAEVESFGSAPVAVLTAESSLRNAGAPMEAEEWARLRLEMQGAIAARSSNSAHRIVERVGHNIHLDDPAETARAIRDVVTSARTGDAVSQDER